MGAANGTEDENMSTLAFAPNPLPVPRVSRAAQALRSLMALWEHGEADPEEESDEDLMVMLSGMVPDPCSGITDEA